MLGTGLISSYTDGSGNNHELSDVWFAQDSTSQPPDLSQPDSVLSLSDILVGEVDNNLEAYLHFQQNGDETLVLVSSKGEFHDQNYAEAADHAITVTGWDIASMGQSDAGTMTNIGHETYYASHAANDYDIIRYLQDTAKLVVVN